MPTPRVCVLRAPGTNCDVETAYAFERSGASAERVHVFRLLETPDLLRDYQILCVPGGFSYGDDIGAGVIFSRQLQGRLGGAMAEFLQQDKLALGICNGFQVLLKAGLLPGGDGIQNPGGASSPAATLTWNDNGKYTALWVHVKAASPQSIFLRGIDELDLPVAHAEGRVVLRDGATLARLREQQQIALQYTAGDHQNGTTDTLPYPANPNGSTANIAGLCDATGRVLGLMPHPERFLHATQHPQWTRLGLRGDGDGLKLFRNAVEYFG
jgi:phosphoribosylformylglycinamidine synthase